MSKAILKPCSECGGNIKLYSVCNSNIPYHAKARCMGECKKEYPLPEVKLKTWKSNSVRISKSMVRDAEKAWNRRANNE